MKTKGSNHNSQSNDILKIVLSEFNTTGHFKHSVSDLRKMGCAYASILRTVLKSKGYINEFGTKIKYIDFDTFLKLGTEYANPRIYRPKLSINDTLSQYTDKNLVDELRSRGYEVTATKTIKL